jgi:Protein of unknown function (DUF3987)/Bifunctional DNA primase/polymerase, N-terminal
MNVLERRRRLIATGYPVIPLYGKVPPNKKNNKRKSLTGWEQLGDVTDEMLVMWSKTWPDAQNTGILTRTMPTLDLDILNEEAVRALEDHVREHYEERGPILVRIGKPPKRAIPFRTIEPFAKFVVNLIAVNGSEEKIEFLGDGAQVAAFGVHPETNEPYRWHGGMPGDTKLEELPYMRGEAAHQLVDELVQILVDRFGYVRAKERPGKRRGKRNGKDVDEADRSSAPADWQFLIDNILAGRALHDSLRDLAAKMIKSGMNAGAVVNSLRAIINNSQAPRDERFKERYDDIPQLVRSAQGLIEAAAQPESTTDGPLFDPWEKYIVPVFPLDVLPPVAQDYVAAQSTVMGCCASGLAMSVLATFSGALHHGFAVKMMRNGAWYERPRLWVLLVADPAQRKTPIINSVTAPLAHYETHLRVKYEADLRDFEMALEQMGEGTAKPRKPDSPPRYIVWDTTVEKLGELLARSPKGLLVKSDEISGWLGNMERYNAGRSDRGFWLCAYDGGPHSIDRIRRGEMFIKNLSVSLLGGIQPARLAELQGLTSDGLLQRFVPVMMGSANLPQDSPSDDEKYSVLVR